MNLWQEILMMLGLGLFVGIFSGLFGIGGGIILIPILVLLLGYSQVAATGTSLIALLLPVGFLAVLEYYKAGKLDASNIRTGLFISIGMFLGAYIGAKFALQMPATILRKSFSGFLVLIALRLWLF